MTFHGFFFCLCFFGMDSMGLHITFTFITYSSIHHVILFIQLSSLSILFSFSFTPATFSAGVFGKLPSFLEHIWKFVSFGPPLFFFFFCHDHVYI